MSYGRELNCTHTHAHTHTHSEEAGVPELIDGVLDRTRYDDSILFSVGNAAEKLRGKSNYVLSD